MGCTLDVNHHPVSLCAVRDVSPRTRLLWRAALASKPTRSAINLWVSLMGAASLRLTCSRLSLFQLDGRLLDRRWHTYRSPL